MKRNLEKSKVKKLAYSLELKYGEEANYLPSIFQLYESITERTRLKLDPNIRSIIITYPNCFI